MWGRRKETNVVYLFIYSFIRLFIYLFIYLYTGNHQFKKYILDKNKLLNLTDLYDCRCEWEPE